MEQGNLSINSTNILPIIKKWLYSETDIFIRELVSNASDAISKLKKLSDIGEITNIDKDINYRVTVRVDKKNKKIFIEDNGIGMTTEEIKKYINEIAFSGATDFVNKYSDKIDGKGEIIGHFGLGFYSSFMVADTVEIDSLSYLENATPVNWSCEGGIEYKISESPKTTRGTLVTLHITDEHLDFLNTYKLKDILKKYCSFIPVDIYFEDLNDKVDEKENKVDENEKIKEIKPINNKEPLWTKKPSECSKEEYLDFYKEVFNDFKEPLFWIHLNMDYPFKLKGILYFPKLKHELDAIEGQVKLYNNQVFIADNIKEVIPEFLLLLKGVIDCPDLPLNVSRSFLQNDGYVTKMSKYITKKVADKLNSQFKSDRESYSGYWENINQFIKYGCIKDKSFYEKVSGSILFKDINNNYVTINEYISISKENDSSAKEGGNAKNSVFYATDLTTQSQYITLFKENNLNALLLPTKLDPPFISYLEQYNDDITFVRIDSDVSDILKNSDDTLDESLLTKAKDLFTNIIKKDNLNFKMESLKNESICSMITQSEESRRMKEMSEMFSGMSLGDMKVEETLILNQNNSLVKKLLNMENTDKTNLICEHIYDLAKISYKGLDDNQMSAFIKRNNSFLEQLIK